MTSTTPAGNGPTAPGAAPRHPARPSSGAAVLAVVLVAASVVVAALIDLGQGFKPRVETLDALAGLSIGAFIVDRLLTFVPPFGAAKDPQQRSTDLTVLRLGYGAVLGAAFVVLTDLRAVEALTSESSPTLGSGIDRGIAVLAIAGGVAGLARLLSGINPQPATDGDKKPNGTSPADPQRRYAPTAVAYRSAHQLSRPRCWRCRRAPGRKRRNFRRTRRTRQAG